MGSQPMADMGKQRSLSTPNTPQQDEAAIAGEQPVEGFFEFKMRKMSEKKNDPDGERDQHESFDTNEEIQDIDWGYDKPLPPPPPPRPEGEEQPDESSPSNGSV